MDNSEKRIGLSQTEAVMGSEEEKSSTSGNGETVDANEVALILNVDLERLVGQLLRTAARSLHSEEASILVLNGDEGELSFLKAIGKVGDQLEGVVIPAGKGIASFVASSGQPMAISDVGQEASFYAEIDKKTGFSTEILLATPLIVDDEIIGVLEFVNRIGGPPYDAFTPEEMDRAAIYAEGIAALVSALQAARMTDGLARKVREEAESSDLNAQRLWISGQKGKREHLELLELAILVKEIAGRGKAHRRLCRELLEAMLNFADETEEDSFSDV